MDEVICEVGMKAENTLFVPVKASSHWANSNLYRMSLSFWNIPLK